MMLCCQEANWTMVDAVKTMLLDWLGSTWTSLPIEHSFAVVRQHSKASKNGDVGDGLMWHSLWSGDLLKQWDRKPPVIESDHVGKGMADPGRWRHEAPGKDVDKTFLKELVSRESWVPMPPSKLKLSCMQYQILLKYGNTWSLAKRSWLTCLASPGCLLCVTSGTNKGSYLILASTEYGWAGVRCKFKKNTQQLLLVWPDHEIVVVDAITDPAGYNMASVTVMLPDDDDKNRVGRLTVRMGKDNDTLLKWHAKRGFSGLTVSQVQHLGRHLNITDLKCRGSVVEDDFIRGMVRNILGPDACSAAVLEEALKRRHMMPGKSVVKVLPHGMPAAQNIDEDDFVEQDIWPDEVMEDLKQHQSAVWGQVEKHLNVSKAFDESWKEFEDGAWHEPHVDDDDDDDDDVAATTGASASSSTVAPGARRFSPITSTSYTAQEAKQWLPEGWNLVKDTTENRWRLSKKGLAAKSRSYGSKSGVTEHQCLLTQLAHAWAVEKRTNGTECPWDLQGL